MDMKAERSLLVLTLLASLSLYATGWTNCCCGDACPERNRPSTDCGD